MKLLKKISKRLFSVSIGLKLTFYFVVFGFIVGYMTFIILSISSARHNIEIAYETIVPFIQDMTGTKGDDFITSLINKRNDELVRMYDIKKGFDFLSRYQVTAQGMLTEILTKETSTAHAGI